MAKGNHLLFVHQTELCWVEIKHCNVKKASLYPMSSALNTQLTQYIQQNTQYIYVTDDICYVLTCTFINSTSLKLDIDHNTAADCSESCSGWNGLYLQNGTVRAYSEQKNQAVWGTETYWSTEEETVSYPRISLSVASFFCRTGHREMDPTQQIVLDLLTSSKTLGAWDRRYLSPSCLASVLCI